MFRIYISTFLAASMSFAVPAPGAAQEGASISGKDAVKSICTACHKMRNIQRSSGYSAEGWKE